MCETKSGRIAQLPAAASENAADTPDTASPQTAGEPGSEIEPEPEPWKAVRFECDKSGCSRVGMQILSIESDAIQAGMIRTSLQAEGYKVDSMGSGRLAIRHMETTHVDLLVLDWHVPDVSGFEVLGWIRSHIGERVPVLILTCRSERDQRATMFTAGADDCVVKPVGARELTARVNALLRRAYPDFEHDSTPGCIEGGGYRVDLRQCSITLHGRTLILTPREFDLASLLFRHVGCVVPRAQLCRLIWGTDQESERILDCSISRLRRILELDVHQGARLRTVHQIGYCLEID